MVHDEYFINKETGEVLTGEQAIHQYYAIEKHKALEAWTDAWQPTGKQAASVLNMPDFSKAITL